MNFDRKTYATRKDLRKEPVTSITLQALDRWIVPIRGYPSGHAPKLVE